MYKQFRNTNYSVSEDGQVRNDLTGKILKGCDNGSGYRLIDIPKEGRILVHRMVAETFLPNPNNLPIVEHKDDNPANNSVNNLMWSTQFDNLKRPHRLELISEYYKSDEYKEMLKRKSEKYKNQGYKKSDAFTEKQRLRDESIIKYAKEGLTVKEIAEKINVCEDTVRSICKSNNVLLPSSLESQYNRLIDKLIDLIKRGMNTTEAAKELGINASTGLSYFSKRHFKETGKKLLEYKPKKTKRTIKEQAQLLYEKGLSVKDISEILDKSEMTIEQFLN